MNENRNMKKAVRIPVALFFANLFKMIVLANSAQLGIDFYKVRISFSYRSAVFWCCAFAFSALIAVFYSIVRRKNETCANIFGALLAADPAFMLVGRMSQCLILYIAVFVFLCNHIKEKSLVKTEIPLFVLSFVCALLFPPAIFSCVALMLGIYVVSCKPADRKKAIFVVAADVVLAAAGGLLNQYLPVGDLARQLNALSVVENNTRILLVLSIPYVAVALFFVYKYAKEPMQKANKKDKQKAGSVYALPVVLLFVYAVAVVGGLIAEPLNACMALCLLNPALVLLLTAAVCRDSRAEQAIQTVSVFVNKHIAVILLIATVVVYIAIRIVLKYCGVDNTIANLITSN